MHKALLVSCIFSGILFKLNAYDDYTKYSILYSTSNDVSVLTTNNKSQLKIKSSYSLEGSYGKNLTKELSIEAQYSYNKVNNKSDSNNSHIHSLYINGIYNFPLESSAFKPYLGLGIGASLYGIADDKDTVFSYQAFAGSNFYLEHDVQTFFEFKYKDFLDVEINDKKYDDTSIHSIGLGIITKF